MSDIEGSDCGLFDLLYGCRLEVVRKATSYFHSKIGIEFEVELLSIKREVRSTKKRSILKCVHD